jgi:hypothetical protein
MIDINKKYRTRDGREVRIYATDGRAMYPIHGAILQQHGWQQSCWAVDGLHSISSSGNHSGDIIEVRPRHKRTVWMNVYGSGIVPEVWSSKENADRAAACGRIACIKVELDFEEGEGL